MTAEEAGVFRKPHWRESGRKSFIGLRIAIIAIGVIELGLGVALEFPINEAVGLSNAMVGVALIGLGFSLLIFDDAGKAMKEDFQNLSAWLDGLLTNRESPLVSRMEVIRNGILGKDATSISSEINTVKREVRQTEETVNKQPGAINALKGEIEKLSEKIGLLEERQIKNIQNELTSLENRQAVSIQNELSLIDEKVSKLPTYKELKSLKKEINAISKRLKKVEEWNR